MNVILPYKKLARMRSGPVVMMVVYDVTRMASIVNLRPGSLFSMTIWCWPSPRPKNATG
jgi:hypothetical protein